MSFENLQLRHLIFMARSAMDAPANLVVQKDTNKILPLVHLAYSPLQIFKNEVKFWKCQNSYQNINEKVFNNSTVQFDE
jgi:hypothetical protein